MPHLPRCRRRSRRSPADRRGEDQVGSNAYVNAYPWLRRPEYATEGDLARLSPYGVVRRARAPKPGALSAVRRMFAELAGGC